MSLSYRPSSNATAGEPWDTAFLSDRDVSAQVPINFVPHPGIYVTPACFPDRVYDTSSAQTCLSNLLASEIRRFHFDLYWDVTNRIFSLCPVQIPRDLTVSESLSATYFTALYKPVSFSTSSRHLTARQTNTTTPISTSLGSTISNHSVASATTSHPSISTTTGPSETTIVHLGPYQCSINLDIDSIVALFNSYQDQTSTTIQARLLYLVFNLHVAAPYTAPTASAPTLSQGDTPRSNEVLSSRLKSINKIFYTPPELASDRQNLNATWYRRSELDELPISAYFTTQVISGGVLSTSDGWPNENYVQLNLGKSIVAGIGTIDQQLANYPFEDDGALLFSPGELSLERNVTLDSMGRITDGCFYNPSDFKVNQVNNSWAISSVTNLDPRTLANAADNLTTCGISPVLNYTIQGAAADTSPGPYQDFGNQALFSWAYGEPKNSSSPGNDTSNPQFRCALMVSNSTYESHWRVENCENTHYAACRQSGAPYLWSLSTQSVTYYNAAGACTSDAAFGTPRNGLENTYLYHSILNITDQQQSDGAVDGVWINFNSLSVESCWVTTGANGTCPYNEDADTIRQRKVLVPAIAALIVILLTVLTILVKCNENRRNSKVRRRGEGGWDYEGVPS